MDDMPYCDELCANQLADLEEIPVTRDSKQKGDWIADISHNQFDRQRRIVNVEITAPPGEKAIGKS